MRIESLSFSYPNFPVFLDFSLNTDARTIGLKGPPGCGKTTLLKLMAGALVPSSLKTMDLGGKNRVLILQEDSLFPWLSGLDNIKHILQVPEQTILSHALYPLVSSFVARKAFSMSFGQRRTIELFRAILYRPGVLCLDEPFNFVDSKTRDDILHYLRCGDFHPTTLVITTHHGEDLEHLEADQFIFSGQFPISHLERLC